MRAARSHRYDKTLEARACSIREDMPDPTISAPGRRSRDDRRCWGVSHESPYHGQPVHRPGSGRTLVHSWARACRFRRRGQCRGATRPPRCSTRRLSTDHRWHLPSSPTWLRHGLRAGCFPALTCDGELADHLLTKERTLVRIPEGLSPRAAAPHTDAGPTAYRVVKRVRSWLESGDTVVPIGFGGLGQSSFPIPHVLALVHSIVVHRPEQTRDDTQDLRAGSTERADVEPTSDGRHSSGRQGAAVPLDVVSRGSRRQRGSTMTCRGVASRVVGYGGRIDILTGELVDRGKTVVGEPGRDGKRTGRTHGARCRDGDHFLAQRRPTRPDRPDAPGQ